LNAGTEVTNTIFWKNSGKPTSPNVAVSYSALDSMINGTNNIPLFSTPFVNGYRINSSSPAYNSGTNIGLETTDTLDLDYKARLVCDQVDMGAYEYPVITTRIIEVPQSIHICEGGTGQLTVVAEGTNLTYQWQRNGVNLNQSGSTLALTGTDTCEGLYRVIVFGDCCNDTSVEVRVDIDLNPSSGFEIMKDVTIDHGQSVELRVISSVGAVTWYESDFSTKVLNPLIQNITETRQYVAVSENGVCADQAIEVVTILVRGTECDIKTHADTLLCPGESYRLLLDVSLANYRWYEVGTDLEIPRFSLVTPDITTRYVARGQNASGQACNDTLTITVHEVEFEVMNDESVCGQPGGRTVQLWSNPQADWSYVAGGSIGYGNIELFVENNVRTLITATYSDGICETSRQVSLYSNPPNIQAYPIVAEICEGGSVQLSTNVEQKFVTWRNKMTNEVIPFDDVKTPGPIVSPTDSTVYQAWIYDELCSDIASEATVVVQKKPEFKITTQPQVCENSSTFLMSSPNASRWTSLDGIRVANPITPTSGSTYVGWLTSGACTVSDTITITMQAPPASFTVRSDTTIIEGQSVTLWSEPAATQWIALPNTIVGAGTQVVTPRDTTVYVADLNTGACGTFRDTVNVYVEARDTFYVYVTPNSDCFNEGWAEVDVIGTTGPYRYAYSYGNSDSNVVTGLKAGSYTVTVTDANDLVVITPFTIAEADSIRITFSTVDANNSDCNNGQITATVTGGNPPYFYIWSDDENEVFNSPNRNNMEATLTIYTLTVVDSKGCEQTANVTLRCSGVPILPASFMTPNGDGKNDVLEILRIELYPKNEVAIINSFGVTVRTLKNYNNTSVAFDGKNDSGKMLPDGVYYYVVKAEGMKTTAGWVYMSGSKSR
jgi:gliding motility-associated-like protein